MDRKKGRKERGEANCFLTRKNNTNSFSPCYFQKVEKIARHSKIDIKTSNFSTEMIS